MVDISASRVAGTAQDCQTASPWTARRWRVLGGLAIMLSAAVPLALATPQQFYLDDPALARLMQSMALIKLALAVPMTAIVWWRVGLPIAPLTAAAYLALPAMVVGSSATILKLAAILPASAVMHAGLFGFLVLLFADKGVASGIDRLVQRRRFATSQSAVKSS